MKSQSTDGTINRADDSTALFKNKYRIHTTRLRDWDYRSEGIYFITICTHGAAQYFGQVKEDLMNLSEIGDIAHRLAKEIPNHAPHAAVNNHVVMPNHIHLILAVQPNPLNVSAVRTGDIAIDTMSSISPKSGSVSTIIRSFKSAVTQRANALKIPFKWQPRFHDHIIRNERAYEKIWTYIEENPRRWNEDLMNPAHPDFHPNSGFNANNPVWNVE